MAAAARKKKLPAIHSLPPANGFKRQEDNQHRYHSESNCSPVTTVKSNRSHLSVDPSFDGHRPNPGLGQQNRRIRAYTGPVPVLHLPKLVCPEDGCAGLNPSTAITVATVFACTYHDPRLMIRDSECCFRLE